jgi:23S rRNA pseudouridine1911/1915/1917 synthase
MPKSAVEAIAGLKGHMLHSESLEFDHPISGETVRFEAAPPEEFQNLLDLLKKEDIP